MNFWRIAHAERALLFSTVFTEDCMPSLQARSLPAVNALSECMHIICSICIAMHCFLVPTFRNSGWSHSRPLTAESCQYYLCASRIVQKGQNAPADVFASSDRCIPCTSRIGIGYVREGCCAGGTPCCWTRGSSIPAASGRTKGHPFPRNQARLVTASK